MQAPDFTKMVPGFDFLQGLLKNAGTGVPGLGQWVAPTLDPDEIDKRIGELRTVQYWLEQNARLLGTTIQALEVQRMTLATLKSMNLPLGDLRSTLETRPAAAAAPSAARERPAAAPSPAAAPASEAPAGAAADSRPASGSARSTTPRQEAAAPAVDPMQWWGALTRQFGELASQALQDGSAARTLADAMVKAPAEALAKAAAGAASAAGVAGAAKASRSAARTASKAAPPAAAKAAKAAAPAGAARPSRARKGG